MTRPTPTPTPTSTPADDAAWYAIRPAGPIAIPADLAALWVTQNRPMIVLATGDTLRAFLAELTGPNRETDAGTPVAGESYPVADSDVPAAPVDSACGTGAFLNEQLDLFGETERAA